MAVSRVKRRICNFKKIVLNDKYNFYKNWCIIKVAG